MLAHHSSHGPRWIIVFADTGEQISVAPWIPDSYPDRQSAYDAMVAEAIWRRSNPVRRPMGIREVAR